MACKEKKQDGLNVCVDDEGQIVGLQRDQERGYLLCGYGFFDETFSKKFLRAVEKKKEECSLRVLLENDNELLFNLHVKEFDKDSFFDCDLLDQLRLYDDSGVNEKESRIFQNIRSVLNCKESDLVDFQTIKEGRTNTSFVFSVNGDRYVYRHPGDGTADIIDRKNEKQSQIIAKQIGLDPTFVYMDEEEGWKISKHIESFREPDYDSFEDSKMIIKVLKKLHKMPVKTDYGLRPWEDAIQIENLLAEKDPDTIKQIRKLKEKIELIYRSTVNDGIEKCFCHGDTYRPNWMILKDERVLLIDWEYSGFSDPGIDVGYYIVDAMYDLNGAKRFIKEYLGDEYSKTKEYHYLAYTAIIAYYWYVWALYRQSCGADIADSLKNWKKMSERYADILLENHETWK